MELGAVLAYPQQLQLQLLRLLRLLVLHVVLIPAVLSVLAGLSTTLEAMLAAEHTVPLLIQGSPVHLPPVTLFNTLLEAQVFQTYLLIKLKQKMFR
jgi:hypothetical protein